MSFSDLYTWAVLGMHSYPPPTSKQKIVKKKGCILPKCYDFIPTWLHSAYENIFYYMDHEIEDE